MISTQDIVVWIISMNISTFIVFMFLKQPKQAVLSILFGFITLLYYSIIGFIQFTKDLIDNIER